MNNYTAKFDGSKLGVSTQNESLKIGTSYTKTETKMPPSSVDFEKMIITSNLLIKK